MLPGGARPAEGRLVGSNDPDGSAPCADVHGTAGDVLKGAAVPAVDVALTVDDPGISGAVDRDAPSGARDVVPARAVPAPDALAAANDPDPASPRRDVDRAPWEDFPARDRRSTRRM